MVGSSLPYVQQNTQEAQLERLAMVVWLLQQDVIEEIDLYT